MAADPSLLSETLTSEQISVLRDFADLQTLAAWHGVLNSHDALTLTVSQQREEIERLTQERDAGGREADSRCACVIKGPDADFIEQCMHHARVEAERDALAAQLLQLQTAVSALTGCVSPDSYLELEILRDWQQERQTSASTAIPPILNEGGPISHADLGAPVDVVPVEPNGRDSATSTSPRKAESPS